MSAITHLAVIATTNNQTSYPSPSFTPAAGELLQVAFSPGALVATTGFSVTASANGITFVEDTRARAQRANVDDARFFVAEQLTPGTPVAMTITVTPGNGAASGMLAFISSASAMSRVGLSAVRGAAGGNQAAAVAPSAVLPAAALSANPVLTYAWNATNPSGLIQPSFFTAGVADTSGYATPTRGGRYAFRNTGQTSATVTWGSTSATASVNLAVELDTSAAPVVHVLVVDKVRSLSRATQPTLAQKVALVIDKARALSRVAQPLVAQASALTVSNARALSRVGQALLTQHGELTIDGARAATRAGSPVVAQRTALVVDKVRAATRAARPLLQLIAPGQIAVNGARSATRASRPLLAQRSVLLVTRTRAEPRVGEVELDQRTDIAVEAARSDTRASSPFVSLVLRLVVNGARAPTRAGRVDLGISTPPSRTYVVPHEIRTYVVPFENRTIKA